MRQLLAQVKQEHIMVFFILLLFLVWSIVSFLLFREGAACTCHYIHRYFPESSTDRVHAHPRDKLKYTPNFI